MMTVIVAVDRSIVRLFFSSMSYSTYSKPNNPSRILCHRKEGVVWYVVLYPANPVVEVNIEYVTMGKAQLAQHRIKI